MATFATSTQVKRWMFTQDTLKQHRENANNQAIQRIKRDAFLTTSTDDDGSTMKETPVSSPMVLTPGVTVDPVSSADEQLLLLYWHHKIEAIVEAIPLPPKVSHTAQVYLKRCFIHHSIVDYDLKLLSVVLVYIAGKVKEAYVSAEKLSHEFQIDEREIRSLEMTVMSDLLLFDFIVYTPHMSFKGFLEHLKQKATSVSSLNYAGVSATATEAIDRCMASDAVLLYPPGQLALACLNFAADASGVPSRAWKEFWDETFGTENFAIVSPMLSSIWAVIEQVPIDLPMKKVKAADRRLIKLRKAMEKLAPKKTPKRGRDDDDPVDSDDDTMHVSKTPRPSQQDDDLLMGPGDIGGEPSSTTGRGLDFSNM